MGSKLVTAEKGVTHLVLHSHTVQALWTRNSACKSTSKAMFFSAKVLTQGTR